jgi:VWFA-related protein
VNPIAEGTTVKLRSDLVTLSVSVADPAGRPLGNLSAADFQVIEDGVAQRIEHFATADQPFALVLVIDLSGSTIQESARLRTAASAFIDNLGPDDRLAIITFASDVELLGDLTSDRAALRRNAARIGTRRPIDDRTGTAFYDAVYLACVDGPLAELDDHSRLAVVVLSDCVDSASTYDFRRILEPVERSGASVFVLVLDTEAFSDALLTNQLGVTIHLTTSQLDRYYDAVDPTSSDRGRARNSYSPLERIAINHTLYDLGRRHAETLAKRTGGLVLELDSLADAADAYRTVAEALHSTYTIGYYPTNRNRDGAWRQVRVNVPSRPGVRLDCRPGYWAPRD